MYNLIDIIRKIVPYTLIFFATSDIALPLFKAMATDSRFKILGLVCQPDKPSGRGMKMELPPTKHLALQFGIPVFQPERLSQDSSLLSQFQENPPDFLLTFAYGQLIPDTWLTLPKIVPLNVHPSLLPLYRGPSPIQYALLNGERETGISLMKMSKAMDEGPLAAQIVYPIPPHATSGTLFAELGEQAAQFIPDALIQVADRGESIFKEQDHSKATFSKKIEKEDGRIDFKKSADEIFKQFCAFTPWPGIFTTYKGQRLRFCEVEPSSEVLSPGQVKCDKHFIFIGTSDGSLKVRQVQLEGKKIQYVDTFILGQADLCSSSLPS